MFVQVCERTGDLLVCDGHCYGAFHPQCIGLSAAPKGKFLCRECNTGGCALCPTQGSKQSVTDHKMCARTYLSQEILSVAFRCPHMLRVQEVW